MNVEFTTYNTETGEIDILYSIPETSLELYESTPKVYGHYKHADYFIDVKTKEVIERPSMSLSISPENKTVKVNKYLTISGLPKKTIVSINGDAYEVNDGTLKYQSTIPMVAHVYIECFPYKSYAFDMEVTL